MERLIKHAVWLGTLLNIASFVSYFTLMAAVPSLRDSAWLNLLLCAVGTGLVVFGVTRKPRWYRFVGAGAGVLVAGLLVVYVYWFSAQIPPAETALQVGSALPAIELVDSAGAPFDLEAVPGKTLILVFYRGFW